MLGEWKMNKRSKKKRLKRILKAASFALAMTAFSAAVYATQLKEVSINYLGENISFKTVASTVSEVLKEQKIELKDGENLSADLDSRLYRNNNVIKIEKPVIIAMAEEEKVVEEIIKEEVVKEVKEEIKPKPSTKPAEKTTATSRGKVRTVWGPDVSEVEEGVLETSDGQILEYTEVMQLEATAYCPCYKCCGKYPGNRWYNITATGTVGKVGVIAVDPRVIPLGTQVYIEGLGGAKNYGFGSAEDTGGAIKGQIIDLYFNTHKETINWGRQQVKVYILKEQ
jgi:3D (Asp-Asp-Asp) domain-containing protein